MQGAVVSICGCDSARPARALRPLPRPLPEMAMDLATWIPGMFLLGLATLAAMAAFVKACDKV